MELSEKSKKELKGALHYLLFITLKDRTVFVSAKGSLTSSDTLNLISTLNETETECWGLYKKQCIEAYEKNNSKGIMVN